MASGGNRVGAGRPQGSGKFGEPTKAIRIPINCVDDVLKCVENQFYRLPFFQDAISAGFPSPAADDMEDRLDLNQLLIKHPAATFFLRVSGSSMIRAGIHHNDILVVDRSLEATHGKVVIAALNGELTVKRLHCKEGRVFLVAENPAYAPIEVTQDMNLCIWGVVIHVIHSI